MNFFYGINNEIFKSELQIPLFQNKSNLPSKLKLFKCFPKNSKWILKDLSNCKINEYFYFLKNEDIFNEDVFFLCDEKKIDNFNNQKLLNLDNFTDTLPAFRANLKIYINKGGFSSYQSEYPFSMVTKKGTILSSISSLGNQDADKNYLLIKNIFQEPIKKKFNAYLINHFTKKIEEKYELTTNSINCIEINNKFLKPEIFFVTQEYLGVPMYASIKNKFLSFEHTHPSHEYLLGNNKFIKVNNLKKEINEIIG